MYIRLFFFLLIVIVGCEKNPGNKFRESVEVSSFSHLEVDDVFDIELIQDSLNRVTFEGTQEQLKHVYARVEEDTLRLGNSSNLQWINNLEHIQVQLHFESLQKVILFAPSYVYNKDTLHFTALKFICYNQMGDFDLTVDARKITFVNSDTGGGTYYFSGFTKSLYVWQRGISSVNTLNLKAGQVRVKQNSLRPCKVHAIEQLNVTIDRPSNVYYTGKPAKISREIVEGGQLIPYNE